ncbi:MAG: DUF1566 domain-containing protein [Casimicrobium sp.]
MFEIMRKRLFVRGSAVVTIVASMVSSAALAVTCVSNITPSNPDSAYTVHGDGTATDTRTGLMWKVCSEGQTWSAGSCTGAAATKSWAGALSDAEAHLFAGQSDWRVPNVKELRSLVEECAKNPSINSTVFPQTPSWFFWSGSPYADSSSHARDVDFDRGDAFISPRSDRSNGQSVRLVRGGQSFGNLAGPTSVTAGRSMLRVGATTTLTPTPSTASLAACTSSNTAVATVAAGTVTAVARGDVTITCGGASTTLAVRNPRVFSVVPEGGHAYAGYATTFVITGRDLDGPLRFSITGCDGNGIDMQPITTPPLLVNPQSSAERRFVCVPRADSVGARQVRVQTWDKPAVNWAAGFPPGNVTEPPGCDQSFVGCTVTLESELAMAEAQQAAKDAAVLALRNQYASATGLMPWNSLTSSELAAMGTALRNAGVKTDLSPALWAARQAAWDAIDSRTVADVERIGGTLTAYSAGDLVPGRGLYTAWFNYATSPDGMSGAEWIRYLGGVSANAALAVSDVVAVGNAAKAAQIAKSSRTASSALKKWLKYQNATPRLQQIGRVMEKLALLADVTVAASDYGQLTPDERADWKAVLELFKPLIRSGTQKIGVIDGWVNAGGPSAGLNPTLKGYLLDLSVDFLYALPSALLNEGISKAAMTSLLTEMGGAAVDAIPVVGRWKSVYESSVQFWDGQGNKVFGNVADMLDAARGAKQGVTLDFDRLRYRLLFDEVDERAGQSALIRTPQVRTQTLPAAGFNEPPADIKRVVVAAHGWNSDANTWSRPLVDALCARRGLPVTTVFSDMALTGVNAFCNGGGWLIMGFNWAFEAKLLSLSDTVRTPTEALANARKHGEVVAADLYGIGVRPELLHVIGHSAGAGFVQAVTDQTKIVNPALVSHSTFLDAYCPDPYACTYGLNASWAEQYVDHRFSIDPALYSTASGALEPVTNLMTDVTLKQAYSFDVTSLDPQQTAFTPTDNQAWPYRLYVATAGGTLAGLPYPVGVSLQNIGPKLSAVWSGQTTASTWLSSVPAALRAKGVRCEVGAATSTGYGADCVSVTLAPADPTPTLTGAGPVQPTSPDLRFQNCLSAGTNGSGRYTPGCPTSVLSAALPSSAGKAFSNATAAALAPATARFTVRLSNASNQFSAAVTFSGADTDAHLSLYIDEVKVYTVAASVRATVATGWLPMPMLAPGEHVAQWVFAASSGYAEVQDLSFRLISSAPSAAINGVCGSAHAPTTSSLQAPTGNLCATGAATGPTASSGKWAWQCVGAGTAASATSSCAVGMLGCDRDVDGNGAADAAIDGVLLNRYLLGYRGAALTQGLQIPGPRNAAEQIEAFLGSALQYDVFARPANAPTALIDGLLHSRIMNGVADSALLTGVTVPAGAGAQTPAAVRANVLAGCLAAYPAGVSTPSPSMTVNTDQTSLTSLGAVFPVATAYSYVTGVNGRTAVKFNGPANPGAIRIPNTAAMQFTTGATFDFWARIDSDIGMNGFGQSATGGWAMALVSKSHDSGSASINAFSPDLSYPGGGYGFGAWASSVAGWGTGPCTIAVRNPGDALGQWFRVTAVASATNGTRVYHNKQLVYSCPSAVPSFTGMNGQDLYIGKYRDTWYPLNGAVQDIRIYQQALTDAQVQALP